MRIYDLEPNARVVYLIGFSATGFVRRQDGPDTPIRVTILSRLVQDSIFMEIDGGNDEYAAVEVHGTAITWNWGDQQGMLNAVQTVLDASVWIDSGQINGIIKDAATSINRVVGCEPLSGKTVAILDI
jgi:hypothetical protein